MRKSDKDKVLVVAACITLSEAMKAADQLAERGLAIRILDPFTIKPLDKVAIIENAREVGGRILTVEDHYVEGGLGEAVMAVVAAEKKLIVRQLAVKEVPHSGTPEELLDRYGISAEHIAKAAEDFIR